MSVHFNVIGRKNPAKPTDPKKFYSQTISKGHVDIRQLSEQISHVSTVSTIDTMAVLEALLQVIPQNIANGQIVRLGDFGNFRLSVHSAGSEKAEDVTAANIKSNKLRFLPGKEIKKVLNNIDYKKAG